MKIDYLNEFIVLAKAQSFTVAAEKLYLTQPALSRHIAAMETELNATLIKRTTHSVKLTSAGYAAIPFFEEILSTYKNACSTIATLDAGYEKCLRVGFLLHALDGRFYQATQALQNIDPAIKVDVRFVNAHGLAQSLENKELDACLLPRISFPAGGSIEAIHAVDKHFCLLVTSSDPLAQRKSISLREVADRTFVVVENEPGAVGFVQNMVKKVSGVTPPCALTPQKETQLFTMKEPHGIALGATESAERRPSGAALVPVDDEEAVNEFCWFFRKADDSENLRAFLNNASDLVKDSFGY